MTTSRVIQLGGLAVGCIGLGIVAGQLSLMATEAMQIDKHWPFALIAWGTYAWLDRGVSFPDGKEPPR